jgi:hypothetical protein
LSFASPCPFTDIQDHEKYRDEAVDATMRCMNLVYEPWMKKLLARSACAFLGLTYLTYLKNYY